MTKEERIENLVKIQTTDGNWNYDPYMHGMANGLILALATLKGEEPDYIDKPEMWISENPLIDKPVVAVAVN